MIIIWRVTEDCNLSCRFCAYDRDLPFQRRNADPEVILKFGQILAEFRKLKSEDVLVSWLGGEPLLYTELQSITKKFSREFGLHVSTTTNGTTLGDEKIRSHIIEDYAELTISIDGLGQTHDRLRNWPGGYSFLRKNIKILSSIKKEMGIGPTLRANVILMRDNIHEFEDLCGELAHWGISEVTFNQLGGRDRPEFYPDNRLLPSQVEEFSIRFPEIRRRLAKQDLKLLGSSDYLKRIKTTSLNIPLTTSGCVYTSCILFVDESGRIAPCHFTVDDIGASIGGISTVKEFEELPRQFAKNINDVYPMACSNCMSTQVFGKYFGGEA